MGASIVGLAFIIMLVLLFLKVPAFVSILAGSAVYFIFTPDVPTQIIAQRVIAGIESIPLLAIPFFIGAAAYMNYAGVSNRIYDFADVVTGHVVGGLAQVNVLVSTLMGGMSGSNLADASMDAKMLVPQMVRKGYSNAFSSVVTAFSAIITPLIPPGIAMILYGSLANISIGKLFVAGFGPGILLCIALMIMVHIISKKRGYKPSRDSAATPSEFFDALKKAFLPLLLPLVIIGGIRIGIFTPTEAGSAAVVYALFLGLIVYREMGFKEFVAGLKETVTGTCGIMLIVGAASAFSWILTREKIPQLFMEFILTNISNKYLFLIAVNLFLLVIGMFIEGNAAMIILVPLLAPTAAAYGIDEIQFAMTVIFNLAIGCVTPPVGTLMFVTCGITKCKIKDFLREAVPFYALIFICLILITFVPAFSTGIVNLVY